MSDNYTSTEGYLFYSRPPTAGAWVISETLHVEVTKKPNWFHKKMTKLLLGWEWQDAG